MLKLKISLSSINDIKQFINASNRLDSDIDLVSGRYVIDGKSIMGVFSLDLSQPITVNIHADEADRFLKEIDDFVVNENEDENASV